MTAYIVAFYSCNPDNINRYSALMCVLTSNQELVLRDVAAKQSPVT